MQTSLTIDVGERVLPDVTRGYDTAIKIHAGILRRIKTGHSGYEDAHTDTRLESFFGRNNETLIAELFAAMSVAHRIAFHIERRDTIYNLRINVKRKKVVVIAVELNISASHGRLFGIGQIGPKT